MKTKLIPQPKEYQIIERDETGLIPDWVDKVVYLRGRENGEIQFCPKDSGYPPAPFASDKEERQRWHKECDKLTERCFPILTPTEVQGLIRYLEVSLIDSE